MNIIKLDTRSLAKSSGGSMATITSGAQGQVASQSAQLPPDWMTATYSPGWPIQPFTRPGEVSVPREIDYPISVNATLQPRTGYGLMPFEALKEVYDNIFEVKMPIATIV